ncbi:flagellar basal body L-ring protein FlgH [Palleronia abyssalis]|nr:flagellar basal body L-ring protein FlgH [Palleronia abyssalis]
MMGLAACGQTTGINAPPPLTPVAESPELVAMQSPGLPLSLDPGFPAQSASLWAGGRDSLLGTSRAETRGDIVTVIIEIDDRAEFSNSSDRSRTGSETMSMPSLIGIPQRLNGRLPDGATMESAVGLNSDSSFSGDGKTSRNEKLTLRVAATVTDILPNGSFAIEGRQELRLNYELRELVVTGFVRPEDISRRNEILYDKIAAARISYGGRGQITNVQQPRYGQRVVDAVLPF